MSKRTTSGIVFSFAVCVLAILLASRRSGPPERIMEKASTSLERPAPTEPVVDRPASLPAPATVAKPAPPASVRPLNESALMESLRAARNSGQLQRAIQLAREGNGRFPNSDSAPERASILVHSLADNEQRSEARGEAEHMVNHYPDSEWVREVEQFTGARRHRNVRLSDEGEVEYY